MHARERQIARALESLAAAHAVIGEARALEAAAAGRRRTATFGWRTYRPTA
jgi:hypothetical protein